MNEPICRHFRTKKMYLPAGDSEEKDMEETAEPHCWCNLTMTELGADDRVVSRNGCLPGRPCYHG